jgi:hypothetical protein
MSKKDNLFCNRHQYPYGIEDTDGPICPWCERLMSEKFKKIASEHGKELCLITEQMLHLIPPDGRRIHLVVKQLCDELKSLREQAKL